VSAGVEKVPGDVRVLVPLADGFEEIEATVIIDVLRRARFQVLTAGLSSRQITASRKTVHVPDWVIDEVLPQPYDLIALPGGRPGADHLAAYGPLLLRIREQADSGGWLAAICAAPLVLDRAGVIAGKRITCHPGAIGELVTAESTGRRVEVDGKIVTGVAAGASFDFALELVKVLGGEALMREVNKGLLFIR
jgi:4-methyl-5(b-hydroxyethyl)-thiazole monophosphate biosynthesis